MSDSSMGSSFNSDSSFFVFSMLHFSSIVSLCVAILTKSSCFVNSVVLTKYAPVLVSSRSSLLFGEKLYVGFKSIPSVIFLVHLRSLLEVN